MSEVFSVLLHNRQRYEQGKEGLWFSLPTTTEKLQAALREIGISADNPQDFFLYDYRSPQARPIKLPRDMVLSAGMDELNFLAARLEKLDAAELMELNAALTSPQSDFHNIGQIIDYPENVDFYVHLPDVTGTGQLGDYYLNRSGMVDMPEEWKAGILLPRFGLHIANTEQGVFTDYGYLVKSGDEWQRVHEGQPVPEEYRVMAYPAPEILREESKVQPEAAAPAKVPQSVTPILLNGQNSAERMKEITDRLETGIQELFESERYKACLLYTSHGQGLVVEDREQPCRVDPHQPIRLRPAKGRLIQAVVVGPRFQMGKAVFNGRVLHAGNPKALKRFLAARHLVDKTENQFPLAPGVGGTHKAGNLSLIHI